MKQVAVECRDIRLGYGGAEVLKNLSLKIEPGEFFALLGPSGSGKSTLLRLIAGFNRQQSGSLLIDGRDVGREPPWRRNVGMVFQNYALWPHLSVWDNVAFGLVERRAPRAEIRSRVGAALDLVGLAAFAQRRPNQLSGGQQQRVALARTIVIEPQVLLLDEPLSNLDRNLRVQMREELLAMQRRLNLTTIFVTHDQEEAMGTADRMAVLDQGVLQQVGTPGELYDFPVNPFVAGFVGTMNLLDARVRSREADGLALAIDGVGAFHIPPPPATEFIVGDAVRLAFRPHSVRLEEETAHEEKDAAMRDARLIWLSATVQAREFLGEFTRYRVRVGSTAAQPSLIVDRPHRLGSKPLEVGRAVWLAIEPLQTRLFGSKDGKVLTHSQ